MVAKLLKPALRWAVRELVQEYADGLCRDRCEELSREVGELRARVAQLEGELAQHKREG